MDEQEFDFENRILSTFYTAQDQEIDTDLRPKKLTDYIGQDKVKENLKVYIDAAKLRGDTLDHVLLYGPPGLGKTTLSGIIANEMGTRLKVTSGPTCRKETYFLSTKFTALTVRLRKFCTRRWKTMRWTLLSERDLLRAVFGLICRILR